MSAEAVAELTFPNEVSSPERRLELARKNAGYQVNEVAEVLGVSRNLITDYQTPGKIKHHDLNKILAWCLLCEVRPSWVSPEYAMYDVAVIGRLQALHEAGLTFYEEVMGEEPDAAEDDDPGVVELPDFLTAPIGRTRRYLTSLAALMEWEPSLTYPENGTCPTPPFDTYWN